MPLYREDNYLVVHTGSETTMFSFGLQEQLSPPPFRLPSKVYKNRETGEFSKSRTRPGNPSEWEEIHPIKQGKIINMDGYLQLLRIVLHLALEHNQIITLNQIPLLLINSSLTLSRRQVQEISAFVFDKLELPAFNWIDQSLAAVYGLGVMRSSSCVVNIGADHVQVVPVVSFTPLKFASRYLASVGGQSINAQIKRNLPQFTDSQVEALKKSGIYEVVLGEGNSYYSMADLQSKRGGDDVNEADGADADDFDVAKLVTEDNGKIVVKTGDEANTGSSNHGNQEQDEENQKQNTELETNWFIDPENSENKIYVGKERFQGAEDLISTVAQEIYRSLSKVPSLEKRQECWDNLIFIGSTFKIPGFKKSLLIKLVSEYLVRAPEEHNAQNGGVSNIASAISKYQQTGDDMDNETDDFTSSQVPTSIKTVKEPEYFSEWKKPKESGGSWEDVYFLGGEIYAKQIFGGNSNPNGEMFLDSAVYEEKGSEGIWNSEL